MTTLEAVASARVLRTELEEVAERNVCATCGNGLLVAHVEGLPRLRCGKCGYDPEPRPKGNHSLRARYRRGEGLSAIEKQTLWRQLRREIEQALNAGEQPRPATTRLMKQLEDSMAIGQSLSTAAPKDLMTHEEAQRFVDMAKLQGPAEVREMAVAFAQLTGLNPTMGEFMLYEGKLYVTADGMRSVANQSGLFDGMAPPKFLTADEKAAEGYAADDVVCRVEVYRKGQRYPIYGTGKANAKRPFRNSAVEVQFPQRMAETRAWRHAFRQGFQDTYKRLAELSLSRGVEVLGLLEDEEPGAPGLPPDDQPRGGYHPSRLEPEPVEGEFRNVDTTTGEITDTQPPAELDMMVSCPVHGEEFFKRGSMKYHAHIYGADEKGDNLWCARSQVLAAIFKTEREAAGLDEAQAREFTRKHFAGKPPSGLSDEERCVGIALLRNLPRPEATGEIPAGEVQDA